MRPGQFYLRDVFLVTTAVAVLLWATLNVPVLGFLWLLIALELCYQWRPHTWLGILARALAECVVFVALFALFGLAISALAITIVFFSWSHVPPLDDETWISAGIRCGVVLGVMWSVARAWRRVQSLLRNRNETDDP